LPQHIFGLDSRCGCFCLLLLLLLLPLPPPSLAAGVCGGPVTAIPHLPGRSSRANWFAEACGKQDLAALQQVSFRLLLLLLLLLLMMHSFYEHFFPPSHAFCCWVGEAAEPKQ
jgi:hypothetical protein